MEMSPMALRIRDHWRDNFPERAREIEAAGELEECAARAAERAAGVMEQCLRKGMNWSQAHELATEEWREP